jgi:hypothetical protein
MYVEGPDKKLSALCHFYVSPNKCPNTSKNTQYLGQFGPLFLFPVLNKCFWNTSHDAKRSLTRPIFIAISFSEVYRLHAWWFISIDLPTVRPILQPSPKLQKHVVEQESAKAKLARNVLLWRKASLRRQATWLWLALLQALGAKRKFKRPLA